MSPALLYDKRDGIAYLTFNRPEVHNAWNPEVFCRLADAWADFAEDDLLRVAIITGAGDKAFAVGADLATFIPLVTRARQPEDDWDRRVLEDLTLTDPAVLRNYPLYKPVIAAVNGFCLAGGTELLQGTDIRIAAEHATFGLSESKRALVPGGGSMVRLARQIPYCKAMEILLTGDRISAEEAYKIETQISREVFASEDAREGPRAFMEKRDPRYTGR